MRLVLYFNRTTKFIQTTIFNILEYSLLQTHRFGLLAFAGLVVDVFNNSYNHFGSLRPEPAGSQSATVKQLVKLKETSWRWHNGFFSAVRQVAIE